MRNQLKKKLVFKKKCKQKNTGKHVSYTQTQYFWYNFFFSLICLQLVWDAFGNRFWCLKNQMQSCPPYTPDSPPMENDRMTEPAKELLSGCQF